jgi:O-antigen/teichoic acid export membrane protein
VQGLNYLMPLLMLPYLLRVLSPESYGSIMFAQSLMGYAAIFTDFGFNFTATRDISLARDDADALARVYWTTMAAKACLLLLSGLLVAALVLAAPAFRRDWPVFAASFLIVPGNLLFPLWYLQGLERLKEVALVQAIAKCVVAASVVVLVRVPQDLLLAAVILSVPQLAAAAAGVCLGKRFAPAGFYRPSVAEIGAALRGSWHMFAAGLSTSLYQQTNTFVLGLMSGPGAVALYSLGTRVAGFAQSLAQPVIQATFPRASLLLAQRRPESWVLLRRIAWLLLPALALVGLLLAWYAPVVARLLGGPSYAGAAAVLRILAALPLLVTAAALLAQTIMVNLGLTRQLSRIYLAVGLLNLLLLPGLIHWQAAAGAAWSLLAAETLGPLLMLWVLRRHRDLLPPPASAVAGAGSASNLHPDTPGR